MFTGLIQKLGEVTAKKTIEGGQQLTIMATDMSFKEGESIAVNGVCLTAQASSNHLEVAVSPETLAHSNLGQLKVNAVVNIEKALKVGDELGGHWVTGHVDCTACIESMDKQGEFIRLVISGLPNEAEPYLIKKGSITIDGISLTINQVSGATLECMIIPHTLNHTVLKYRQKGESVNIEYDYLARIAVKQFEIHHQASMVKDEDLL